MHILNIQTPSPPPNFCFGSGILWCCASGTRTIEHFSNICAQMQPSWLSLEHGVPRALIGCLCRAWAFGQAALSASCVSLQLVSGGFANRQAGLEGQTATWERTEVSPPSETDTGTGRLLSWVVDWQRSKSSGGQVWLVAEEPGCFQGNWGVVQPLFSKKRKKFC